MSIDLDTQIKCVEREISMRGYVYKRNVELGKMAQATADRQIAEMRAVLATLQDLLDTERSKALGKRVEEAITSVARR